MRILMLATISAMFVSQPLFASGGSPAEASWPQWRGPHGNGVAEGADPPVEWSETHNVAWKAAIPGRGLSSPIVWGGRIFLLTAVDTGVAGDRSLPPPRTDRRGRPRGGHSAENVLQYTVLALDASSGEIVWQHTARETQPTEGTHTDGSWASMSAVTDGDRLIASFGSAGLYSYSLDGEPQWSVDLGDMTTRNGFGEGSSPVLHGDRVVVNWDHEGPSFVVALDKRTGEELWRRERDEVTSWSTPLVVEQQGRAQVVTSATKRIRSYDLESGDLIWEAEGMTVNTIPTPVHRDGVVYAASGFRGNALLAVRLAGASGNVTGTDSVLWSLGEDMPYVPSPLLYEDTLYFLKRNSGVLTCVDPVSGKKHYGPQRLEKVANVYASPVGAQNRVYIAGRDGHTAVLRRGVSFEILAVNELDEGVDASLAIVGDAIYLRGSHHLYKIQSAGGAVE